MNKVIIVALLMCLLLTTTTEGFGRRYLVRKVEKSVEANHQSLDESMHQERLNGRSDDKDDLGYYEYYAAPKNVILWFRRG
ncbi:unnamed protein product [Clavelina lepadiformis]|uniref:Uncharacterized protein n=1 Tax=Clavelina lepadiformis TaxID=159417 RepID=A0ABP0FDU9_CLALP